MAFVWLLLPCAPVAAQSTPTDLDRLDDLEDSFTASGPEIEADDIRVGPKPPWTLQLRMAGDWRSNANLSKDSPQDSSTIISDVTLWRGRPIGSKGGRIFVEVGLLSSRSMRDAGFDTSSIFGTFELEARDRAKGVTPYVGYEPFLAYDGGFGQHLLTLHNFTLGARRQFGPSFVDVYIKRKEASIDIAERLGLGLTVFHNVPLGAGVLNVRAEVEGRRYDQFQGFDRRDFRARLRARAIVPIAYAVDLQVTADVQHLSSNREGFGFTNVIVGPTIIGRFGF